MRGKVLTLQAIGQSIRTGAIIERIVGALGIRRWALL